MSERLREAIEDSPAAVFWLLISLGFVALVAALVGLSYLVEAA